MKRVEFESLKANDICTVKRGTYKDKKVIVRYIEDEWILVKSLDNSSLTSGVGKGNSPYRLYLWRELDRLEIEGEL